ncbi:MMPL family transporter [Streptomyces montanisoli]|uniref:MMPL family transporter n=1 Tax=Streptomyces montanisoli TaxID=2798581 RepID=A0A940RUE5_9ACTN|nr:MMPL family transporter [Streptomyces montanisoli]MBP0457120.1 MMPL family transporter [Streptomyces montanisoli]
MAGARSRLRWLVPALLVVAWLAVGGTLGPYAGKLGQVATNDQAAFLPKSAESTKVLHAQKAFDQRQTLPAIAVWSTGDSPVTPAQRAQAADALSAMSDVPGVVGAPSPPMLSKDGRALEGVVNVRSDLGDRLAPAVTSLRHRADHVDGARAEIAGPAASQADLSDAFAGIDGLLLGVALLAVLLILVLVYRSVLMPFVVIISAVFALGVASAVVYALARHGVVHVDGQVQGILSILVIGASTDYALLLTARFREELARAGDRFAAVRAAVRRSVAAITASAATVALALLALLLSDLSNNRALGPVGAIGIVCAVVSTLTFVPAVLVLLGRAAYWPTKPRAASTGRRGSGIWNRVAGQVDRHPRRIWAGALVLLCACAAFAPTLDSRGVPLDETFTGTAPSVQAQKTLDAHFPGGSGQPAVVIAAAGSAKRTTAAAAATPGVTGAAPVSAGGRPGGTPKVVGGKVSIEATLAAAPDSDAAKATIVRLRERVRAVPGAHALVGGYTAQQYDTQTTAEHDRTLIIPVVLLIILVILFGLLRSVLLPLLLVATVALNYGATLGVSSLVFQHLLGFTGTDASVPLYGFVFLVALGVDYNIFLMTRVREESLRLGSREGVLRGLTATGGVITSAGVVLAVTFAALAVIPLSFLVQIAFIVAFGVLLDTLLVRSLLVPALVRELGDHAWWPARPRTRTDAHNGSAQ